MLQLIPGEVSCDRFCISNVIKIKYAAVVESFYFHIIMDIVLTSLVAVAFFVLILAVLFRRRKRKIVIVTLPDNLKQVLENEVLFYKNLAPSEKKEFEQRVFQFLSAVKITGINTTVEDTDRALIGASAIIPIFQFPDWEYVNLHEVLLYPESFDDSFAQKGHERNILGMVGDGALNHVMVISQSSIRQDFQNKNGKSNTAIHEFVHLVDKTDGSTDGIPEVLLQKPFIIPWIELMQKEIGKILQDKSDINPYGATNKAEFLAVVSEYFFERPELLKEKHPELFELLSKIFNRRET
jgi:Mlc titration factor MtfA (ptsG expression regulator)